MAEKKWETLWRYAEPLMAIFTHSIEIKDEASIAAFYLQNYQQCIDIINDLLMTPGLDASFIDRITRNKSYCLDWMKQKAKKTWSIPTIITTPSPFVLVCHATTWNHVAHFLTSCQDAAQFSKLYYTFDDDDDPPPEWATSFTHLNNIQWPCVYDEWTPYIFLMTGSWLFFDKRPYLSLTQSIIDAKDPSFAQVFVNKQADNLDYSHVPRLNIRYCTLHQPLDMTQPSLIYREILFEHKFQEKNYPVAMLDAEHCCQTN